MKQIEPESLPYTSRELDLGPYTLRYLDEGPTNAVEAIAEGAAGESSDQSPGPLRTPTLLCVHGNPTWSFYFRSVVSRFSGDFRVVAVDHIGCGRSDKPPRGEFAYTLASHRDNLVELVDSLDLRQITLVAHDWGGAIGLAALLKRRERFERIVLLNTGAFPPPYIPLRIAACRWPLVGSWAVRGLNLFARSAVSMAMARRPMASETARGLLAPYDSWQNRVAIDSFVRDIPTNESHPTFAELATIEDQLPTLSELPIQLIWGMKDWCFRPECLHRFQSVWPAANTTEVADAGHYVLEDAPEDTLAAMERFFATTESCVAPHV